MVKNVDGDGAATIGRLEARVETLERALADRSRLLRQLTRVICEEDLMNLSRLSVGQPPLPRAGVRASGLEGNDDSGRCRR